MPLRTLLRMAESNVVITATSKRVRKLSAAHFAFMRGLVQGLPVRDMWDRYLSVEGTVYVTTEIKRKLKAIASFYAK